MKKSIKIAIALVPVLIVGLISTFFFINRNQTTDGINSSDLQEYMPDMTKGQIDEIAKTQLDEESAAIVNEILNNYSETEIDEILEDDEETGIIIYKDKEGNLVEYDTNSNDLLKKSEDELNAETEEMLKSLSDIAAGNFDQAETDNEPAIDNEELDPDKYIGETTLPGDQPNPEEGVWSVPEDQLPDRIKNGNGGGLIEMDPNTKQLDPNDYHDGISIG